MGEKRKVVVAVDGSADSSRAVEWAVAEARSQGLPLQLVHAVPHLLQEDEAPPVADQRTRVDQVLQAGRQMAAHAPAVETEVRRLEPFGLEVAPAIVSVAEPGDLFVLGARGHGRVLGARRRGAGLRPTVVRRDQHVLGAVETVVGAARPDD